MSTVHPPPGRCLTFTLIAVLSFGNGADFRSTQSSSAAVRKSTRRRMRTTPGNWRRSTIAYMARRLVRSNSAASSTVRRSG